MTDIDRNIDLEDLIVGPFHFVTPFLLMALSYVYIVAYDMFYVQCYNSVELTFCVLYLFWLAKEIQWYPRIGIASTFKGQWFALFMFLYVHGRKAYCNYFKE